MKKCGAIFFVFVLMINLCGCVGSSHNVYEEIYKRYYQMESYSAVAEVTVKTDKTENSYRIKQLYSAPDSFFVEVLEPQAVEKSGFSSVNGETRFFSGVGNEKVVSFDFGTGRSDLFVSDFFEAYFESEETAVFASKSQGDAVTVMECFLNGKNEKRFLQRLWVDNKTFLPIKLETCDINKNPVVTVVFEEFERNCDIDQGKFE